MDNFGSIPEGGDKATDGAGPPASRSPAEMEASSAQPTLRDGRRQGGVQQDEADVASSAQPTLPHGRREDGQRGVQQDEADVASDAAGDVPCLDTDAQGGDTEAAAAGAAGPRALTSADVRAQLVAPRTRRSVEPPSTASGVRPRCLCGRAGALLYLHPRGPWADDGGKAWAGAQAWLVLGARCASAVACQGMTRSGGKRCLS